MISASESTPLLNLFTSSRSSVGLFTIFSRFNTNIIFAKAHALLSSIFDAYVDLK